MTRSQVRYLLGTPMLADPFDPQRWDYIYTLQRGRERHRDRAHYIVQFEGDKVSRIEKPGRPVLPQGTEQPQKTPAADQAPLRPNPRPGTATGCCGRRGAARTRAGRHHPLIPAAGAPLRPRAVQRLRPWRAVCAARSRRCARGSTCSGR